MKLLLDTMLGTLSRWLRILGHDAVFAGNLEDDDLLAQARAEGRVLLTRDRQLAARAGEVGLYVASHDLDEQLVQVIRDLDLPMDEALSRCSVCNTPLEPVSAQDVKGRVPEGVLMRQINFWHCPACNRYYWPGSHYDRMVQRIERLRNSPSDGRR